MRTPPIITAFACFLCGRGSLPTFQIAIDSDPQWARIEINGEHIGTAQAVARVHGNAARSLNGA